MHSHNTQLSNFTAMNNNNNNSEEEKKEQPKVQRDSGVTMEKIEITSLNDPECAICLSEKQNPFELECKHAYCETCITGWVDRNGKSCPLDKLAIGPQRMEELRQARTQPPLPPPAVLLYNPDSQEFVPMQEEIPLIGNSVEWGTHQGETIMRYELAMDGMCGNRLLWACGIDTPDNRRITISRLARHFRLQLYRPGMLLRKGIYLRYTGMEGTRKVFHVVVMHSSVETPLSRVREEFSIDRRPHSIEEIHRLVDTFGYGCMSMIVRGTPKITDVNFHRIVRGTGESVPLTFNNLCALRSGYYVFSTPLNRFHKDCYWVSLAMVISELNDDPTLRVSALVDVRLGLDSSYQKLATGSMKTKNPKMAEIIRHCDSIQIKVVTELPLALMTPCLFIDEEAGHCYALIRYKIAKMTDDYNLIGFSDDVEMSPVLDQMSDLSIHTDAKQYLPWIMLYRAAGYNVLSDEQGFKWGMVTSDKPQCIYLNGKIVDVTKLWTPSQQHFSHGRRYKSYAKILTNVSQPLNTQPYLQVNPSVVSYNTDGGKLDLTRDNATSKQMGDKVQVVVNNSLTATNDKAKISKEQTLFRVDDDSVGNGFIYNDGRFLNIDLIGYNEKELTPSIMERFETSIKYAVPKISSQPINGWATDFIYKALLSRIIDNESDDIVVLGATERDIKRLISLQYIGKIYVYNHDMLRVAKIAKLAKNDDRLISIDWNCHTVAKSKHSTVITFMAKDVVYMPKILALVTKNRWTIHAICLKPGNLATYTQYRLDNGEIIRKRREQGNYMMEHIVAEKKTLTLMHNASITIGDTDIHRNVAETNIDGYRMSDNATYMLICLTYTTQEAAKNVKDHFLSTDLDYDGVIMDAILRSLTSGKMKTTRQGRSMPLPVQIEAVRDSVMSYLTAKTGVKTSQAFIQRVQNHVIRAWTDLNVVSGQLENTLNPTTKEAAWNRAYEYPLIGGALRWIFETEYERRNDMKVILGVKTEDFNERDQDYYIPLIAENVPVRQDSDYMSCDEYDMDMPGDIIIKNDYLGSIEHRDKEKTRNPAIAIAESVLDGYFSCPQGISHHAWLDNDTTLQIQHVSVSQPIVVVNALPPPTTSVAVNNKVMLIPMGPTPKMTHVRFAIGDPLPEYNTNQLVAPYIPRKEEPRGIINLGNTCYAASVLQMMDPYIVNLARKGPANTATLLAMRQWLDSKNFKHGLQHDAGELLQLMLDQHSHVGMILRDHIDCSCGNAAIDSLVPIISFADPVSTITQGLQTLSKRTITGKCSVGHDITSWSEVFVKASPLIYFNLGRVNGGGQGGLTRLSQDFWKDGYHYVLDSIIDYRVGVPGKSGHYTAWINTQGKWWYCNDATIAARDYIDNDEHNIICYRLVGRDNKSTYGGASIGFIRSYDNKVSGKVGSKWQGPNPLDILAMNKGLEQRDNKVTQSAPQGNSEHSFYEPSIRFANNTANNMAAALSRHFQGMVQPDPAFVADYYNFLTPILRDFKEAIREMDIQPLSFEEYKQTIVPRNRELYSRGWESFLEGKLPLRLHMMLKLGEFHPNGEPKSRNIIIPSEEWRVVDAYVNQIYLSFIRLLTPEITVGLNSEDTAIFIKNLCPAALDVRFGEFDHSRHDANVHEALIKPWLTLFTDTLDHVLENSSVPPYLWGKVRDCFSVSKYVLDIKSFDKKHFLCSGILNGTTPSGLGSRTTLVNSLIVWSVVKYMQHKAKIPEECFGFVVSGDDVGIKTSAIYAQAFEDQISGVYATHHEIQTKGLGMVVKDPIVWRKFCMTFLMKTYIHLDELSDNTFYVRKFERVFGCSQATDTNLSAAEHNWAVIENILVYYGSMSQYQLIAQWRMRAPHKRPSKKKLRENLIQRYTLSKVTVENPIEVMLRDNDIFEEMTLNTVDAMEEWAMRKLHYGESLNTADG
jgi:hypothetical protein